MRFLYLAVLVALAASGPALFAQEPLVELDHVYVVVPAGATAQIECLREAGFTVNPQTNRHEGQGTASVVLLFENAYFELLWVDTTVAVDERLRADLAGLFQRATAWEVTGASPFGIGLRRTDTANADLRIPVRQHSAAWMQNELTPEPDQAWRFNRAN